MSELRKKRFDVAHETMNKMNFKEHIGEVTRKASKQVGVLLRLRNIIPQSAKQLSVETVFAIFATLKIFLQLYTNFSLLN